MIETSYRGKAILTRVSSVGLIHHFNTNVTESFEVRVMAVADGYAMVRRKGCSPFICKQEELEVVKK